MNVKWCGILSGPAVPQKALCVRTHSLSLAHSWDRGPKHQHRTLSHATTPYGFPIKTVQRWRSEMWLSQMAFSTGNRKWSTPFGVWKCDSPEFEKKWKRIQYIAVLRINHLLYLSKFNRYSLKKWWRKYSPSISQRKILEEKKKKLFNGGIEHRTVTLLRCKRSGPLYIPVKNAICKSHISDRQHWIV